MTKPSAKNWFTVLMSPKGGHLDAAWSLLASDTAPPLNVTELHDGLPVLAFLEYGRWRGQFWETLFEDRAYDSNRDWSEGFGPLPLAPDEPLPDVPGMPQINGEYSSQGMKTRLSAREAIFAKLVAMGADPWQSWTNEDGKQVDGFDVALAWGCTPLVDLCLRHASCPPVSELHERKAWVLREPRKIKDEKGKAVYRETDGVLVAAAGSGYADLAKYLLERGWHPDGLGTGSTPLMVARNVKVTRNLLEGGAQWKPQYVTRWEAMAKKSEAYQATLAERINEVSSHGKADKDPLATSMANELIESLRKGDNQREYKVISVLSGEDKDLSHSLKKVMAWQKLNNARPDKKPLLLEAALLGFGPLSGKNVVRCRNFMGVLNDHCPTQDLGGASPLGFGYLLTAHSRSKNMARGGYTIYTTITDTFQALGPEEKVKVLLDTFRAIATHGTKTQRENARVALVGCLDHLVDHSEIGGEHLTQGLDVFESHFLGRKANEALDRWLMTQPGQVQVKWITALVNCDYPDGLERVAQRLEDNREWQADHQAVATLAQAVKTTPREPFVQTFTRLRRLSLETSVMPEGRDGARALKM